MLGQRRRRSLFPNIMFNRPLLPGRTEIRIAKEGGQFGFAHIGKRRLGNRQKEGGQFGLLGLPFPVSLYGRGLNVKLYQLTWCGAFPSSAITCSSLDIAIAQEAEPCLKLFA